MAKRFPLLLLSLVLVAVQGCALIESATEQVFGPGDVPPVSEELLWPSVGTITGHEAPELGENPDLTDLENQEDIDVGVPPDQVGTFAHLAVVMADDGECVSVHNSDPDEGTMFRVRVEDCSQACPSNCAPGESGLRVEAAVEVPVIEESQAEKMQEYLENVTPEAIVQIRFAFEELEFFQLTPEGREVVQDRFEDFVFLLSNDSGAEVLILDGRHLDSISPDKIQRFDVDSNAPFTKQLKKDILALKLDPVWATFRFHIPEEALGQVQVEDGGLSMDFNMEFVISAIEVVSG